MEALVVSPPASTRDKRALNILPADFQQQQKQIQGECYTELTDKGSVSSKPVQGFELQQKQKLDATYQGSVSQAKLCSDVH